tara:strand:- start:7870 stop:7977 length:108 start_codon:yes stop_codon:yes gene_type:complete
LENIRIEIQPDGRITIIPIEVDGSLGDDATGWEDA